MNDTFVFINGKFLNKENAKISVFDRGFLYGDSVFETLRVYKTVPFQIEEHIDRLFISAEKIKINLNLKKDFIKLKIEEIIKKNNLKDGYIRIIITRGESERGIIPPPVVKPQLIIISGKYQGPPETLYKDGVDVFVSKVKKTPDVCVPSGVKSGNYLNSILARFTEKNYKRYFECIMLDIDNFVAEGSVSNVFVVKENCLITPSLNTGVLPGITRKTVIEIAKKLKIPVSERKLTLKELLSCDECFITNSLIQILPVRSIKYRNKIIKIKKPYKVTEVLIEKLRSILLYFI